MTKNTRDIKEIIGGNIAFLRKGKKWTQLELAEKMDYSDKASPNGREVNLVQIQTLCLL